MLGPARAVRLPSECARRATVDDGHGVDCQSRASRKQLHRHVRRRVLDREL